MKGGEGVTCMINEEILVGIVTLDRKDKLIKTLEECSRRGFRDIVVIDNGSTDGTREFLLEQPWVHAIFSDRNEGGSGGFNRIMRHFADDLRHGWLLLFDDDAYPSFDSNALGDFLVAERPTNTPAYAFKVAYPDGALCEMNRPGLNILDKNPFKALLGEHHVQESTGSCMVDFASFVGILLKRETVEKSGCVSKEFFIYSDDTYYTLSISSRLGKIRYCPEFVMVHDCNRSSRRLINHDSVRLMRDVANKIVLIREYSRFQVLYVLFYVGRLIFLNPAQVYEILQASYRGLFANLQLYRNEMP
jgi:GT2 family glycosyltransferase